MGFEKPLSKEGEIKEEPAPTEQEIRIEMRKRNKEFVSPWDDFEEVLERAQSEAEEAENSFKSGQTLEDCEAATNKLGETYQDLRKAYGKKFQFKKVADINEERRVKEIEERWVNCKEFLIKKAEKNFKEVLERAQSEAQEAENSFKSGQTLEDCEAATNKLGETYQDLEGAYSDKSRLKVIDPEDEKRIDEIGKRWANCEAFLNKKNGKETPE